MISLETLRDHALKNPQTLFPLNDCYLCLAAHLTGGTMLGHGTVRLPDMDMTEETVDPRFAIYTARVADRWDGDERMDSRTGQQIADDIDKILSGLHPHDVVD